MIDAEAIRKLLRSEDCPNLICREFEFKPKNIAMYIAAMGNTMDGYIVIGAMKDEQGFKLINISRRFNINNIIGAALKLLSINPEIEYQLINIEGISVFAIKVLKSEVEIFIGQNLYKLENNEIVKVDGGKIMDMTKVFIVHGHDNGAKQEVARFVERLGLEAIILHEQVNRGKTIIEKIEEYSNVGFAIVLYTPCDEGKVKGTTDLKDRARQNVVFEHGYLIGKLGRERVSALVKGDIEKPNDISGVVYIDMDESEGWKVPLFREMRSVGYDIDMNKIS
ncbi:TIR domain-containing protein [Sutcliffiella cohnii]|uniref:TIR domain-containing protein n=1 Tax=Sutcliffiella cohnii TaxID=33932 RepID=UPI002E24DA4A|nr:TIR domain-containing protein [Sutcliffiella cohnii]MED4018040.1 nucleotide-binding protein [Sutcliffiella cohnii]